MFIGVADRQNGARSFMDYFVGNGAKEDGSQTAVAVGSDNNKVYLLLLCISDDFLGWMAGDN